MKYPFHAIVESEFRAVNALIVDRLSSRIPLVEEIANYLIDAGGKRLRPLLVLLTSNSCNYRDDDQIKLAAVIEFLHTAMLLHDDVVDASILRRGKQTVNAAWGNPASILVGDFLHSRAFEIMVEIGNMRVMQILSHATNVIAEGEVQQLSHIGNPDIAEEAYIQVITRKTATLFQAASHAAAVLAGTDAVQEKALSSFGLHLGLSFQLIDDVLDYQGSTADLGKNIGDDLAEGKATLPLIVAMRNGNQEQADYVRKAIIDGGADDLNNIVTTVSDAGGLEYTAQLARNERDKALLCLDHIPESKYKEGMCRMAHFAVQRSH